MSTGCGCCKPVFRKILKKHISRTNVQFCFVLFIPHCQSRSVHFVQLDKAGYDPVTEAGYTSGTCRPATNILKWHNLALGVEYHLHKLKNTFFFFFLTAFFPHLIPSGTSPRLFAFSDDEELLKEVQVSNVEPTKTVLEATITGSVASSF